jgi:plastocyanin
LARVFCFKTAGEVRYRVPLLILLMLAVGGSIAARAESVTVNGVVNIVNRSRRDGSKPDNSNAVVWLVPVQGFSSHENEVQLRRARQRFQLVQQHKRFEPHVLVVPVGAVVDFPNLDPFFHNVFSLFDGKRFDLGLYEAGTVHSVHFDRPGVCYIFCNIHPEMSAVVVVLKTPYYDISNRAGTIEIPNVPVGRYLVHAWHELSPPETLKSISHEITVSSADVSLGTIRLSASADLLAPHKNKYGRDYDRPEPPSALYEQP